MQPINFKNIRNITVTGRIASGATTLAKELVDVLGWEFLEGGAAVADAFFKETGIGEVEVSKRPDSKDIEFEERVKQLLKSKDHIIIQAHLAGFVAQNIDGVFKILTVCEDKDGIDKAEIRVDRLVNRKEISVEQAKIEVSQRETEMLEKWRRLYADNDPEWLYWDKKYYDLVINTFALNKEASLQKVLEEISYSTSHT